LRVVVVAWFIAQTEVVTMAANKHGSGMLGFFALVGVLGFWMSSGDPPVAEQVGYFKAEENHRVRAYFSEKPLTEDVARGVFDDEAHTVGTLSRTVFYSGESPAPKDALTLAPDLQSALAVTTNPPFDRWDWMIFRNPAGQVTVRSR
jgi:hypothetical protein